MRRGTPSVTALGVAIRIAVIGRDRKARHVPPPGASDMTERLLQTVPFARRFASRIGGMQRLLAIGGLVDRIFVPGMALHLAVRKRFIEDHARQAIAAGARQIVVLGAGFDTLAPRLAAERPEIGSFELDHPATQSEKITGLRAIGAIRPNLNLLSCDLSSEDPDRVLLAHPAFLRSAPSYVVLEGLLMYLDRDQVDRLFARVLQVTQPTSRIALTFIETRDDGSPLLGPWGKALEWRLRRAGEPFRWGVTRNDLAAYLESRDLKLIDAPDKTELRRRYLQGLDDRRLLSWEHVAVAERR